MKKKISKFKYFKFRGEFYGIGYGSSPTLWYTKNPKGRSDSLIALLRLYNRELRNYTYHLNIGGTKLIFGKIPKEVYLKSQNEMKQAVTPA